MSSTKRKEVDPDPFSDDSKDYLLDPDLWLDKLPQPFQMIDEVLQEFLDQVWEKIESRDIVRKQEEARVKVPEFSDGLQVADGSEGVKLIRCVLRNVNKNGCCSHVLLHVLSLLFRYHSSTSCLTFIRTCTSTMCIEKIILSSEKA